MNEKLKVIDLYNNTKSKYTDQFNNSLNSSYKIVSNKESMEVDFTWLTLMEDTTRYLDNILRNPNRFIVNEEEVVKVEQAKRITVESIKHLAKHTNFIQKIEKNGDVQPSKVLNINKDESYDTYENRVIYTLIQNMRSFLSMRKSNLITASYSKAQVSSEYHGSTRVGAENVNIDLYMKSAANSKKEQGKENDLSIPERVERLDLRISDLMGTPVYKTLAKAHVARVIPPIKKTNLILKNVNFQYAMKLWDFLQSYNEGGESKVKENKEYTNDDTTKELFDDVFLLNYLVVDKTSGSTTTPTKSEMSKETIEKLTNDMISKIVEINSDLPIEEIQNIIGDKIAIIKSRREASITEIQRKINKRIQKKLNKILSFDMR